MLSPKFLRFQAARSLLATDVTENPNAIAELEAMARVLERWAPKVETKRMVKASSPVESR